MLYFRLYSDETGVFERIYKNQDLYIYSILIEESRVNKLKQEFENIFGRISSRLHATEFYKNEKNKNIAEKLISILQKEDVFICRIKHKDDIYNDPILNESKLANRFRHMLYRLFEHIMYLYSDFFKNNCTFSFYPNTRVYEAVKESEEAKRFEQMGYRSRGQSYREERKDFGVKIKLPDNENKSNKKKQIFYILDADDIRENIFNIKAFYHNYENITGVRNIKDIYAQRGNKSKDIFVHVVDHIAYLGSSHNRFRGKYKKRIEELIDIELVYGDINEIYREIVINFFQQNYSKSISLIFENMKTIFDYPYYRKCITDILNLLLEQLPLNISELTKIEREINNHFLKSTGRWEFVLQVLDNVISSLENEKNDDNNTKIMLKKFYGHKLRIHNHRAEVLPAWNVLKRIDELSIPYYLSFEEWKEDVELLNREAVIAANMFDFSSYNQKLNEKVSLLLEFKSKIKDISGIELREALIGKLLGTLGQNYAFLAPINHQFFKQAEECFLNAKEEFSSDGDIKRQDIYLAHLYYDWQKIDPLLSNKAKNVMSELQNNPSWQEFLDYLTPESASSKQYLLHLILKYSEGNKGLQDKLYSKFTISRIKYLFKDTSNEHPFEFIYMYLGLIALRLNYMEKAFEYLGEAIKIPPLGKRKNQPTLEAIRAQIYIRYALALHGLGKKDKAQELVKKAMDIMSKIGVDSNYKTILAIENKRAVGGWFENAWNAMIKYDWDMEFSEKACDNFLKYFTFNYT